MWQINDDDDDDDEDEDEEKEDMSNYLFLPQQCTNKHNLLIKWCSIGSSY